MLKSINIFVIFLKGFKVVLILRTSAPHVRVLQRRRLNDLLYRPSEVSELEVSARDIILLHNLEVVLEHVIHMDPPDILFGLILMGFYALVVDKLVLGYRYNFVS